ncbi:MAG: TonB-dependent receptor [Bacteroidales bacterium]|nr:TonB-dependent receptor [Bacteroidales bacterium]
MKKATLLTGALLLPALAGAQAVTQAEQDSLINEDYSLIGVVDASVFDADGEDGDNSTSQDINTTVLTSHDVYLNKMGYQLSSMRFRVRGYESIYEQTHINGVPMNDQLRGVFNFSSIGAINDFTRNGDQTVNSAPGAFAFGSLGGSENILMRAGDNAAGGKATLTYTNRNYWMRTMLSYNTGLSRRGWAFSALVGGRYSDEGNIDGTFYRNFSYALMLEKRWRGDEHSLTLTTFGSPVCRGQQAGTLQEVYDLTGNNLYNPNWGYQNGKKRNARTVKAYDPTTILGYTWKINKDVTLNSGLAFHYGRYGNTSLNWFDGADPRPDYYRYLPSYFLYYNSTPSDAAAADYAERWRSGDPRFTQIDWESLYAANAQNKRMGNGQAIYLVEERRSDLYETTFNATINAQLSRHNRLTAGIVARNTVSRQFKVVDDLLGADYVLDIDKYADTDYPGQDDQKQSDLNRPNRKVYEGGVFGYDFKINVNSLKGWLVNNYSVGHWDAYYGFQLTHTDFFRRGAMRNGHNPDNSYGAGRHHSFTDMMLKGGLTYKFSGRQLLSANVVYGTMAPLANDAYISPRVCDDTPDNLKSSRIFSADLNYIFAFNRLKGRVGVFQTNFYDLIERNSFYYDGVTFVNHMMTGVNKVHRGIELGLTYKLDGHWSFDLAGTVSEYYYANNPMGTYSIENGKDVAEYSLQESERVYMKNVYVGGLPQVAGTFGVRYFIDYWFLGANINAFGRNFIEVAPARRTASIYNGYTSGSTTMPAVTPNDSKLYGAYQTLTHQEEFDADYTIDLSIGKIFYLGRKNSINVNLAFNNILNNKDVRTGGYEQGRVRVDKPELFKSKYFYMQGFNCFLNVSYRF